LRLFSFGGYGLALAALALVVFGAYDSFPLKTPPAFYLRKKKNIRRIKSAKFVLWRAISRPMAFGHL